MSARLAALVLAVFLALPAAPALAEARRITPPAYPSLPAGLIGVQGSLTLTGESRCKCLDGNIYLSYRDEAGRKFFVEFRQRDGRLQLRREGGPARLIAPGSAEEAALYGLIRPKTCMVPGLRPLVIAAMEAHAKALSPTRLQALSRLRLR